MKKIVSVTLLLLSLSAYSQKDSLFFISKGLSSIKKGKGYLYKMIAFDSVNNNISYHIVSIPKWLKYNDKDHSISGKTSIIGQYPIHIVAITTKDTVHQHFMITVYNKHTVNILPLGNSITNGVATFNSYRRNLWQMLDSANLNFNFIGSWEKHHMGSEVPDPDFDMDHEGHSGWTTGHILHPPDWDIARGNIYQWLQTYMPDIVMIELGTNDVFQCVNIDTSINNFKTIINLLRKKNNGVKIFLSLVPPLGKSWSSQKLCGNNISYEEAINELNKRIATLAKEITTIQSSVIIVDQFTGIDPVTDMYDDIHPNKKGERIMAERWFKAIVKFLPGK